MSVTVTAIQIEMAEVTELRIMLRLETLQIISQEHNLEL